MQIVRSNMYVKTVADAVVVVADLNRVREGPKNSQDFSRRCDLHHASPIKWNFLLVIIPSFLPSYQLWVEHLCITSATPLLAVILKDLHVVQRGCSKGPDVLYMGTSGTPHLGIVCNSLKRLEGGVVSSTKSFCVYACVYDVQVALHSNAR